MNQSQSPNPDETKKLARLVASQLRKQHGMAKGIMVKGTKVAGVAFVVGDPATSAPKLIEGSESEDAIYQWAVGEIESGGLPVGFVRWESKSVGEKHEVQTYSQPFLGSNQLGPWAGEMLRIGAEIVRSKWSPRQ
jgi:hypothetical protein